MEVGGQTSEGGEGIQISGAGDGQDGKRKEVGDGYPTPEKQDGEGGEQFGVEVGWSGWAWAPTYGELVDCEGPSYPGVWCYTVEQGNQQEDGEGGGPEHLRSQNVAPVET